ncbi:U3-containing 90S pre-ribosomal complex subunit-domain containing protein [Thamnocephalis sphaerospora]|uniref:U3-containing 90S pre-ribosomal complex subunit-domain containing protein n=1 Tax=Thamnocephalis sphaerospora TaxID=78915 RepID=A0A4P9XSU3_9FUNG|nr:U3-containing 90S pre-ribosomal complex subunit-domain containing protein [Thamnocephalis sphaerospora]|eukprot:RKP09218.1 U3-containing 90S pre-ribosomal complex subunit-domain containing protein [Thamnocephalis sphaerospora]
MSNAARQSKLADDLEDDFIPDDDFTGWASDVADSDFGNDSDDVVSGVKRRADTFDAAPSGPDRAARTQKRRKRGRRGLLERGEETPATARAQADYLLRCLREAKRGISALELDEAAFRPEHFVDTTAFDGEHHTVALEPFLQAIAPTLFHTCAKTPVKGRSEPRGSPLMLVVSSSGIRCTDVIRSLEQVHSKCRVAKLFAKHFKVPEQVEHLKRNICRAAAGTPNRLAKLADDETALHVGRLELVVLDRHRDAKQRSMFDIPEVRADLVAMLDGAIGARVRSGQAKLVVF